MTAIIMLVFALVWVGMVSSVGAPWFFSLFGVLFVILAIFIILLLAANLALFGHLRRGKVDDQA